MRPLEGVLAKHEKAAVVQFKSPRSRIWNLTAKIHGTLIGIAAWYFLALVSLSVNRNENDHIKHHSSGFFPTICLYRVLSHRQTLIAAHLRDGFQSTMA